MESTERVAIFIDGSNFYHGLKANLDYSNIDLGKFCDQLLAERRLTRIYYYNAPKAVRPASQRLCRVAERRIFIITLDVINDMRYYRAT